MDFEEKIKKMIKEELSKMVRNRESSPYSIFADKEDVQFEIHNGELVVGIE